MTLRYAHLSPGHLGTEIDETDRPVPSATIVASSAQGSTQELVPASEMSQKSL